MISAITAGLYSSAAVADISVSGTGSFAYTDAGGNTSSTMGGGVSFSMSTTTDAGVTALTFGFANGSITVGQDVGVADGVGLVGELAHYNDNQTGITNKPGLGDDEGDGVAVSTSVGDMSIALQYVWDGAGAGDVDGSTTTSQGGSLSMPVAGGTLTVASASDDVAGTNMNETAVAFSMGVGSGTLSLGFTGTDGDTAAAEGESMSAAYSTSMGGVDVGIGYTGHDANSTTAQQTDITLSSALGGGVSIFAEYSNVSGTVATETSALSNNTVAVGTSVSF